MRQLAFPENFYDYHPSLIQERQPIDGLAPITMYEWLHVPPTCKSELGPNGEGIPAILVYENNTPVMLPVCITDAGEIKVREA